MSKSHYGDGTYETLPSGRVRLKIVVTIDGIRIRKSFTADSKRLAHKAYADWLSDTDKSVSDKTQTLSQWATRWLTDYCKPKVSFSVWRDYERYLHSKILSFPLHGKHTLGELQLTNVSPAHIAQLYAGLKNRSNESLSRSTLEKIRIILYGVFETAIDNRLCTRNPVSRVPLPEKPPKEIIIFTSTQIQAILAHVERSVSGAYIALLLHTGLRVGELLGLQWSDIDENKRTLHIHQSLVKTEHGEKVTEGTKTKRKRLIPYDDYLQSNLERIPRECDFVVSRFFCGNWTHHTHASFDTIYYAFFDSLNDELDEKIPRITPHKCRHTFATKLLDSGVDIRYVQALLGHTTISTTEVYTHTNEESLRENISKLKW
jgi:integrase